MTEKWEVCNVRITLLKFGVGLSNLCNVEWKFFLVSTICKYYLLLMWTAPKC